jgi:DNA-binding beta-propeller fold protein YncE
MNVKRKLAVAMAGAAVAAGSVAAVGLPATSAHAATTTSTVALPMSYYSHMLLDPAHHHIFITSGPGSSSILVTDYSGQTVATIPNESSATALALSSDGSTVYAVLPAGWISAISTSTLAQTARYFTGTYVDPAYAAYAGGKIWFSYHPANSAADFQSGIGSIDPSTSPATVTLNATNDPVGTWSAAPCWPPRRTGNW